MNTNCVYLYKSLLQMKKLIGAFGRWLARLSQVKCEPKPCIICDVQLYPTFYEDGWKHMQPNGGGEVKFIFAYGSMLDDLPSAIYSGVICDECANKVIHKMEKLSND